jgi:hypothetical protein
MVAFTRREAWRYSGSPIQTDNAHTRWQILRPLSLTPLTISPNPQQGSSQTFTATLNYATVPDGTPILLGVGGANRETLQSNTTNNVATFTYTGVRQGEDTLIGSATVSGSTVNSNNAVVTWGSGTAVTFLSLNQSPSSGTQGGSVTMSANLTDVLSSPAVALSGQPVNFSVGGANCSASNDANGNATCQVTLVVGARR